MQFLKRSWDLVFPTYDEADEADSAVRFQELIYLYTEDHRYYKYI